MFFEILTRVPAEVYKIVITSLAVCQSVCQHVIMRLRVYVRGRREFTAHIKVFWVFTLLPLIVREVGLLSDKESQKWPSNI
jgi:hypothetical protein